MKRTCCLYLGLNFSTICPLFLTPLAELHFDFDPNLVHLSVCESVRLCESAVELVSIPVSPRLGCSVKLFQARAAPCGAVRGGAAALGMRGPSPPHCTSSFQPSMPHASAISRNLPQAFIFHRPSGSRKPLAPRFASCQSKRSAGSHA